MFLNIQKKGKNDWWRWLIVILFIVIGVLLGQLPLLIAAAISGSNLGLDIQDVLYYVGEYQLEAVGLHENFVLFLLILTFAGGLLGLWLGVKSIHERPFRTVITPNLSVNWNKILFSFGLWMGLTVVIEFFFFLASPETYSLQFQPGKFIGLLLVALLFLPIQTSFEEIAFRGYLLQGLALIFPVRWIPLILTSVLFGAMHYQNPEVEAFGLGISMTYYIGVGLFLGIITLMDDGLELALGVHAATNIFGALFVSFDEAVLQTPTVFHAAEVNLPLMIVGFAVAAMIFTFIVAKKYEWKDWTRLYGKVDRPHLNEV